ncbi:hypothetical protein TVAG_294810 [Trichomonas vaginalis G3]|uniref:SCP domain-containing protein n=1 Tax=Trichomonas vaginalis (strain ATCC PRA-98 / G3) TaxID=412133 RepID=A2DL39_TRIV3|nr:DNA-directed 5'-3' RNA polymerase protein [Trichomonas vaginalis G3]EAY18830.1 hypothetical protein TVAG_294810 [Trichomonas vaginalis G3]KAI5526064.1 DNA-directed 5'-3' RNA polymerase protein [Trichomonas vaginalis G3]|eukprot:XP_001579816.1 hypothetical protein [Trichomonas vaginalis G3]
MIPILLIRFEKLEQRSRISVCSRFRKDVSSYYNWTLPYPDLNGSCTQPTYDIATDNNNALRELNYMRWLVGFDTTTVLDENFNDQVVQCAMNCAANGRLDHYPSPTSKCYTGPAFWGCRFSNLAAAGAILNAPNALQQLIEDSGDNNLEVGHRRWIFYNGLKRTTFGGAYDSQSPLYQCAVAQRVVFGDDTPLQVLPFTAYPPPGYFPAQFVYSRFSFWAPGIPSNAEFNISVKINDEPQNLTEKYSFARVDVGDGVGGVMFSFANYIRFSKIVNKRIDIQIKCADKVYDYTIYPIDCSDKPMRTPVPTIEGDDYDKLDIGEAPKQKRQKKVAIGAGVGVSLVVIVIIILVLFIVFRHGCSHNHDNDETNNNNNNNDNNDDHSDSGENHLED